MPSSESAFTKEDFEKAQHDVKGYSPFLFSHIFDGVWVIEDSNEQRGRYGLSLWNLKTIHDDATQKPKDDGDSKAYKISYNIERFCRAFIKKGFIPPAGDRYGSGHCEQNSCQDDFYDVVGSAAVIEYNIVTDAENSRHHCAHGCQRNIRKGNLLQNVTVPPESQKDKKQGSAGQCNREVDNHRMRGVHLREVMDHLKDERHFVLSFLKFATISLYTNPTNRSLNFSLSPLSEGTFSC